mmetsp:Transcript_29492/g.60285  ORF Transcript_29492/g.60285 Transcript_29492/m.60285 type:complete len:121 (-) Transcript_29492:134-496(-)
MLVRVAEECGLNAKHALDYLSSPEGLACVRKTYAAVSAQGINSIPTFIIDGGTRVLNGAARAEELEAALREVEREVVEEAQEAQGRAGGGGAPKERPPPLFASELLEASKVAAAKAAATS